MIINPTSINGKKCKNFNGCNIEDLSVLAGGYIITPYGEVNLVGDNETHQQVFSDYINEYLENSQYTVFNTLNATKILCELGCCVYAGVRLEYFKNKSSKISQGIASLTFPNNLSDLTNNQKQIITALLETNKSVFSPNEKITIQYGSFPDNIYSIEEVKSILSINKNKENNSVY